MLPMDGLAKSEGSKITVTLKDGTIVTGKLAGVDQNINLVLEEGSAAGKETTKNLGCILLRGNSIVAISMD